MTMGCDVAKTYFLRCLATLPTASSSSTLIFLWGAALPHFTWPSLADNHDASPSAPQTHTPHLRGRAMTKLGPLGFHPKEGSQKQKQVESDGI